MLRALLAAGALAAAMLPAAAAQADTASFDGSRVTVTGTDQPENIVLSVNGRGGLEVNADTAGPGCASAGDGGVTCPMPSGGIYVNTYGGDDAVTHLGLTEGTLPDGSLHVDLGAGDDRFAGAAGRETVVGGPGTDEITGGAGDDVLDGGDGNDAVYGDGGRDELHGGAGDDTLDGDRYDDPAADLIDGGPGSDLVEGWNIPDEDVHPRLSVTVDGVADDGRPGEGDDVRDIERITSNVSGTFVTGDGPDVVQVWANLDYGASTIRTNGGNDQVTGLNASETIDGGAGDDRLEGGFGDDTIVGGPGKDTIIGDRSASQCGLFESCSLPQGNDVIDVRDGEADTVSCGVGADRVLADAADTVAADCEQVDRAAGAGFGTGSLPAQPAADRGAERTATLPVELTRTTLRRALKGGLRVRVQAPAVGRLKATASRSRVRVASGSATVRRAGTTTVTLRFSKAARHRLRAARRARISVAVRFTAKGDTALSGRAATTIKR